MAKKRILRILPLLLVVVLYLAPHSLFAQRERNYIYILDCSNSMIAPEDPSQKPIWNETKDFMKTDIMQLTEESQVNVVLFQGKPEPTISFLRKDFSESFWKKNIEAPADNLVQKLTGTNIVEAWKAGVAQIDPTKDNYIYLLTDGQDNKNGIDAVCAMIKEWCGKYKNTYGFYVMLRPDAMETKLIEALKACQQMSIIDSSTHLAPFGRIVYDNDEVEEVVSNVLELPKKVHLSYSAMGKFKGKIKNDDPYFDVTLDDSEIDEGELELIIKAKRPVSELNEMLGDDYQFSLNLESDDTEILNPNIPFSIINKKERLLQTPDFKEVEVDDISHYQKFLFWPSEKIEREEIELDLKFNDEAKNDGSSVALRFVETPDKHGNKKGGYSILANGQPITDGRVSLKAGEPIPVFEMQYDDDAVSGKRYIQVQLESPQELDRIGSLPASNIPDFMTIRSDYSTRWNPLQWILLILAIVIIAALIIWFVIMKPMLYPGIKAGNCMVTEPYFTSHRIHGAQKLVFTNKATHQGWLCKLFTGRIVYSVNPMWTEPFEFTPSHGSVKIKPTQKYSLDPYDFELVKGTDYTVENLDTNDKCSIKII